jgi:hypothetical protein
MLGGLLNIRNYLAVSAVVAIILYLTQLLAGPTFVNALESLNRSARSAGMAQILADGLTEPVKAVITPNSPLGAVAGGLMWPLLGLWLILLVFVVFFTVLGRGLGTAASAIK